MQALLTRSKKVSCVQPACSQEAKSFLCAACLLTRSKKFLVCGLLTRSKSFLCAACSQEAFCFLCAGPLTRNFLLLVCRPAALFFWNFLKRCRPAALFFLLLEKEQARCTFQETSCVGARLLFKKLLEKCSLLHFSFCFLKSAALLHFSFCFERKVQPAPSLLFRKKSAARCTFREALLKSSLLLFSSEAACFFSLLRSLKLFSFVQPASREEKNRSSLLSREEKNRSSLHARKEEQEQPARFRKEEQEQPAHTKKEQCAGLHCSFFLNRAACTKEKRTVQPALSFFFWTAAGYSLETFFLVCSLLTWNKRKVCSPAHLKHKKSVQPCSQVFFFLCAALLTVSFFSCVQPCSQEAKEKCAAPAHEKRKKRCRLHTRSERKGAALLLKKFLVCSPAPSKKKEKSVQSFFLEKRKQAALSFFLVCSPAQKSFFSCVQPLLQE